MSLQFGIPSLDDLLEIPGSDEPAGKHKPESNASSISILGPDGSGKSLLALHLASAYRAWCRDRNKRGSLPKIFYVSSDLEFKSASKIWDTFKLSDPYERQIPFERMASEIQRRFGGRPGRRAKEPVQKKHQIDLKELTPNAEDSADGSVAKFLLENRVPSDRSEVGFLDLAHDTAGDDWTFVNSLIVSLQASTPSHYDHQMISHLVIIDSVAGFETYTGKLDAFGVEQSRRARIAQCVRNAHPHVHVVFVVEEPDEGKRLPEEYVSDVVVRLRVKRDDGKATRTLEIEKSRARNHASGEHPFEIRNLKGASTGVWENADTPAVGNNYVHVFHSLSHRSQRMGAKVGGGRRVRKGRVIPTGLTFLDRLLDRGDSGDSEAEAQWGIHGGSTAALIGEPGTGKSFVGERFLAQGFCETAVHALTLYLSLQNKAATKPREASFRYVWQHLRETVVLATPPDTQPTTDALKRLFNGTSAWQALTEAWAEGEDRSEKEFHDLKMNNPSTVGLERGALQYRRKVISCRRGPDHRPESRAHRTSAAVFVAPSPSEELLEQIFRHPNLRTPGVLLSTSDRTSELLAQRCLGYLQGEITQCLKDNEVDPTQDRLLIKDALAFLSNIIEEQLIVRRIDGNNALGATLFEMIKSNCIQAQYMIYGEYFASDQRVRHNRADRIRVVIDDLRVLASLCQAVVQDSAFLPYLVFDLEREGVTSLIVHTDYLRPGERAADPLSANLISLIRQLVLTWTAPLEGQSRIAINVTPATSRETNGIVRELEVERLGTPSLLRDSVGTELTRVDVTRHLELYAELEGGKPRLVPLAVYLSGSTAGCRKYMEQEDVLFQKQFAPVPALTRHGEQGRVLWPIDSVEHAAIRDVMHLPWDVKANHTIVDQVDGFWSLDYETGAMASQHAYLTSRERSEHEDPFELFSGKPLWDGASGGPCARQKYFRNSHYESRIFSYGDPNPLTLPPRRPSSDVVVTEAQRKLLEEMPDRVPFTWDFSFLMVPEDAWHKAAKRDVFYHYPPRPPIGATGRLEDKRRTAPRARAAEHATRQPYEENVGEIHKELKKPWHGRRHVPWRAFLGACKEVADQARKDRGFEPVPFDFAATSGETLVALVLEIWFSEMATEVARNRLIDGEFKRTWLQWEQRVEQRQYEPLYSGSAKAKLYSLASLLSFHSHKSSIGTAFEQFRKSFLNGAAIHFQKNGPRDGAEAIQAWASEGRSSGNQPNPSLANAVLVQGLLNRYEEELTEEEGLERQKALAELPVAALCLYKTWLLLLDVIDLTTILDPATPFELRLPKTPSPFAMAVRHYYRTACEAQHQAGHSQQPQSAIAMPGFYSARGDSFLASAQASRSQLLAANAIDLLCSRRANLTRMQLGLGLPVRDVMADSQCRNMRTALRTQNGARLEEIRYGDLCGLGATPPPLRRADETVNEPQGLVAPLRWLFRNGMPDYDRTSRAMQKWLTRLLGWTLKYRAERVSWDGGFRGYDALSCGRFSPVATYLSFDIFAEQCDYLIADLQASERRER